MGGSTKAGSPNPRHGCAATAAPAKSGKASRSAISPIGMLASATIGDTLMMYNVTPNGLLLQLTQDPNDPSGWSESLIAAPSQPTAPDSLWCYSDDQGEPHLVVGIPGSFMGEQIGDPAGLYDSRLDASGHPISYEVIGYSAIQGTGSATPLGPSFFCAYRPSTRSPESSGWLGGYSGQAPGMVMVTAPDDLIECDQGRKLVALPLPKGVSASASPSVVMGPSALTCYHGTAWYDGGPWPEMVCSVEPLNEPVTMSDCFAVAGADDLSVQLFAVAGTDQIYSVVGTADPATGAVAWGSWSSASPAGAAGLSFVETKAWLADDGSLGLVLKEQDGALWKIVGTGPMHWTVVQVAKPGNGQWLVVDDGARRGIAFVGADGSLNLSIWGCGHSS